MMKMLNQFLGIFKGDEARSPEWIVQQAKWDPANKLYIVGDIPSLEEDKPEFRTIDSGPIPFNWHQCFYYESVAHESGIGYKWVRCHNLAGPGMKPSFCILHSQKEPQLVINNGEIKTHYCKWGPCIRKLNEGAGDYCDLHSGLVSKPVTIIRGIDPIEDCGCEGYCDKHFNQSPEDAAAEREWAAIPEDIDYDFCNKIGWGQLKYRRGRKVSTMQQQENVHFKLELRGSRDYIDLFHAMLHLCDTDYPLDPFRKNTAIPPKCTNCGGYIWQNAIVTAPDIKRAAKQAGITVKVRTYMPESTCKKKERVATA